MINSHRARMLLPGVADLDTLRYFADLVGEEEIRETSRTTGAGAGGGTRTSSRAGGRCWPPKPSASSPTVTRSCFTDGCPRPRSRCGCGSPIVVCAGSGCGVNRPGIVPPKTTSGATTLPVKRDDGTFDFEPSSGATTSRT